MASVTDFMPLSPSEETVELIRIVRGLEGHVAIHMELALRFGYGTTVPWVRRRTTPAVSTGCRLVHPGPGARTQNHRPLRGSRKASPSPSPSPTTRPTASRALSTIGR